MPKRWMWAGAAACVTFVGAYVGSPYWTARQLRIAAVSGDTDSLEQLVDFPAVRASIKSQLTVIITQKMNEDANLNNPFAGLGMILMPTMINNMVDGFVTPDAIATMATQGKISKQNKPADAERNVSYVYGYRGLDRFGIGIKNDKSPADRKLSFVLDRRGLFTWRLVRIEMPADLLKQPS